MGVGVGGVKRENTSRKLSDAHIYTLGSQNIGHATHRKESALAGLHARTVLNGLRKLVHDLVLLQRLDAETLDHAGQTERGTLAVAVSFAVGETLQELLNPLTRLHENKKSLFILFEISEATNADMG